MTELALEPVRQLKDRRMLGSVSLRTPSNGRRYLVTIAKRTPGGDLGQARYVWRVEEIDPEGEALAGGQRCAIPEGTVLNDPEEAYWAAVDGLCALAADTPAVVKAG